MIEDWWLNALWSITPTIIIGALFGLILYGAINADRKTRRDRARVEREEREAFAKKRDAEA
ncbi:hypothetical protein [Gulosibacter macacae]|uniref:hypothetical protein n=1 Tax=Gulosibacter macacae TaxID=2488791 RepID=UPI001F3266FF|nr:hypothetical protein [Gulosibacter macacae]